MTRKIELTEKQLALISYVLKQQLEPLRDAVKTYTQDNELETAKAFHADVLESEILIDFIDNKLKI
jgi:hypothetical protein